MERMGQTSKERYLEVLKGEVHPPVSIPSDELSLTVSQATSLSRLRHPSILGELQRHT